MSSKRALQEIIAETTTNTHNTGKLFSHVIIIVDTEQIIQLLQAVVKAVSSDFSVRLKLKLHHPY